MINTMRTGCYVLHLIMLEKATEQLKRWDQMIFVHENDIKPHITLAQFKQVWSKNIYLFQPLSKFPWDLIHENNETLLHRNILCFFQEQVGVQTFCQEGHLWWKEHLWRPPIQTNIKIYYNNSNNNSYNCILGISGKNNIWFVTKLPVKMQSQCSFFATLLDIQASAICWFEKHLKSPFMKRPLYWPQAVFYSYF